MGFDALNNCSVQVTAAWDISKLKTGFKSQPGADSISKKIKYTLGAAIAAGANEVYAALLSLAGAASITLDLTALVDVLGNTLNLARVKGIVVLLMAAGDTAPDGSTVGTACSGITVGNAATNQFNGPISDGATGTITLANGEVFARARADATGWVVSGSAKSLKILNADAVVTAKVLVVLIGADA